MTAVELPLCCCGCGNISDSRMHKICADVYLWNAPFRVQCWIDVGRGRRPYGLEFFIKKVRSGFTGVPLCGEKTIVMGDNLECDSPMGHEGKHSQDVDFFSVKW